MKRFRAKSQLSWTADPPAKLVLQESSLLQCVWEGFQGDFSSLRRFIPELQRGHCASLLRLDAWVATFLSYHVVSGSAKAWSCSCPGFWTHSNCWHVAYCETLLTGAPQREEAPVQQSEPLLPEEEDVQSDGSGDEHDSVCSVPREDNEERVTALPPVFDAARHGPVSKANLQDLIDMLQAAPGTPSKSTRGKQWRLEISKGQDSTCKGCRGPIQKHGPRLSWTNSVDQPKRDIIGTYNGFWHITCGAVVSKIASSKSSLVQIDERVLGTFPFANELDTRA